MPIVGFTGNNGTRLELDGYTIKNVEFIPEQEMSSIENTRTILDPNDGITILGIEKNIVNTVTIKLIPNMKKADIPEKTKVEMPFIEKARNKKARKGAKKIAKQIKEEIQEEI